MIRHTAFKHFVALALMGSALPARAQGAVPAETTAAEVAKFQADRTDILAMAGTFKVTFDFREQTAWQADYTPIAEKVVVEHEVVRVIEDSGRRIVLQHILVLENAGKFSILKHWRQDWAYEPASVLVYAGGDQWKFEAVPEEKRHGRWSETAWLTDDSPRNGGWGEWSNEGGVPRWQSNWSWRPISSRRDASRHPVYDRYLGINRYSPTPTGWIHWQDNIKMGIRDGKLVPFVQESVLNTYVKASDFDVQLADDYWAKTKDFWAAVRGEWNEIIMRNEGVHITEITKSNSASASVLADLADDVAAGKVTTPAAIAQARALMSAATEPIAKP